MSDRTPTRRDAIGAVVMAAASAGATGTLAAPAVAEAGLEAGPIRALGVETARTTYQGRAALRAVALENVTGPDRLVLLDGPALGDGVLEAWISGAPAATAGATARGFVGLAFRVQDETRLEAIYLRPTNGRAEDQVRRNHSVQYVSHPDHTWERLRAEAPARYETYVDLEPGRWTHVRIVVKGARAVLYVDGASQPTLVVSDLKHGATARGAVALWIGPGTLAHFNGVRVTV